MSKWHRSIAFNGLAPVEPATAITFANFAKELQQELEQPE